MKKIKVKLKRIKFYLFRYYVNFYNIFKKYDRRIAIVSCLKWKNKVTDDMNIKYYLNKRGIGVDIVAYEEKINFSKYDALIIRSIWGFQKNKNMFDEFLECAKLNNVKIFNSIDIIKNNYDKKTQFKLMDKYNINHVETVFVSKSDLNYENIMKIWRNKFGSYDKLVIKPTVSESGSDTYIISDKETGPNIFSANDICLKYNNINYDLMIQPFIEEIKNGEYSLVCFNSAFSHAIIRKVSVFNNSSSINYIENNKLDNELLDLVLKANNIVEYKENLYMRIDVIKHEEKYMVMELELLDPQLFINSISNRKIRHQTIEKLTENIINRIY